MKAYIFVALLAHLTMSVFGGAAQLIQYLGGWQPYGTYSAIAGGTT